MERAEHNKKGQSYMINGVIEHIIYRNEDNGYTVLEVSEQDQLHTAVGVMPLLAQGEHVCLSGEWTHHSTYGRQFKVQSYEVVAPDNEADIKRYLSSGIIKGIGPATAELIVEKFGVHTLEVMQFAPERLREIHGIGKTRCAQISEGFAQQQGMRKVMMGLQSFGVTLNQALKLYKAFGDEALNRLQENPYSMIEAIQGIGFKTADRIALNMGVEQDSPFRLAAGILYTLQWAMQEGHTCLPEQKLISVSSDILGCSSAQAEQTVGDLVASARLVTRELEAYRACYLPFAYQAEAAVAAKLKRLTHEMPAEQDIGKRVERLSEIQLNENQHSAVLMAVQNHACVITGGPGTGKTTIIQCIIRYFKHVGESVLLCAPTGRAAKRMSEATGMEASTIHRLLEYQYGESFLKDEDDPLLADVVIVDEMSMVDIFLFKSLLSALSEETRLIMVGDADQLPSVGPGNVLKEVIASGVLPVGRLTQVHRQSAGSGIVVNAHRINEGRYPLLDAYEDFKFVAKDDVQKIITLVLKASRQGFSGFDPLCDIQVLSPMKKGELGVINLNKRLQSALNPPGEDKPEKAFGDGVFRVGDKVMQTKNNYKLEWQKNTPHTFETGLGVFNGDMGYIMDIDEQEKTFTILFDDEREAVYEFTQFEEIDLAYCISIHKSQGSEFNAVLLPLSGGPPMLMVRNLLYTAITRAKKMAVLIGSQHCIHNMVDNNRITKRYSGLIECFRAQSDRWEMI
ncbi:MAG: ATP-dependent RecD-like DNA helicase [Christensenellales bacterium]|jgi:exodeoxyribonuclease V alpha subunit